MKKNDIIQLEITDTGVGGEGIGKLDGFPFFVKNAVTGDVVEAVVTKMNKTYGFAKMLRLISKSQWRVEPVCPKAEKCGGCQLMQLNYKKQLEFKEKMVRNNLERIGGVRLVCEADVEECSHIEPQDSVLSAAEGIEDDEEAGRLYPIIGFYDKASFSCKDEYPLNRQRITAARDIISEEQPIHFRNKVQFPVGCDKDGKIITGFYAGRTHYIIEAESCPVSAYEADVLLKRIREFMTAYEIPVYDEKTGEGLVRHVLIRTGTKTGQIMVCLVINGNAVKNSSEKLNDIFVRYMLDTPEYGDRIKSICLNENREKTNVILGKKIIPLCGVSYIEDMIGSLIFRISPLSFFQVNGVQTEKLYKKALEYAGLNGCETVWDLYCGTGTISLFLAQKAKKVFGVEIIPEAIEDAEENARLNGITNAEFFCGRSEEIFPKYYERIKDSLNNRSEQQKKHGDRKNGDDEGGHPDVVVLDPPRKGCDKKLLDAILKVSPKRIVYVSCDSATLARDVKILGEKYRVVKVTPVDMFPHTCHVETVCLLTHKE